MKSAAKEPKKAGSSEEAVETPKKIGYLDEARFALAGETPYRTRGGRVVPCPFPLHCTLAGRRAPCPLPFASPPRGAPSRLPPSLSITPARAERPATFLRIAPARGAAGAGALPPSLRIAPAPPARLLGIGRRGSIAEQMLGSLRPAVRHVDPAVRRAPRAAVNLPRFRGARGASCWSITRACPMALARSARRPRGSKSQRYRSRGHTAMCVRSGAI